jgi:hypothetical protein
MAGCVDVVVKRMVMATKAATEDSGAVGGLAVSQAQAGRVRTVAPEGSLPGGVQLMWRVEQPKG